MPLSFEWDPAKAKANVEKHGITFDEACTVFQDILSVTISDPLHSEGEERFILMGHSHQGRLLIIVHTDRGEKIRIISARQVTRKERRQYEENAE